MSTQLSVQLDAFLMPLFLPPNIFLVPPYLGIDDKSSRKETQYPSSLPCLTPASKLAGVTGPARAAYLISMLPGSKQKSS